MWGNQAGLLESEAMLRYGERPFEPHAPKQLRLLETLLDATFE
jgi:hypothetical protein